ncbi:YheC/YheD family protein [Bacillus sp. AFS041924]|uniref:YheC/YheD family endospore coat-associated protein n=1 Tax=Bacillus sp. AFS041924 TaxID=2033503 RepID=UPI000BFE5B50|nr:YheC/YheD family protein [Bacillus sp. AFS041924]PGS47248.1 glutathione synthetase [Bacillus sp. AFS041924]
MNEVYKIVTHRQSKNLVCIPEELTTSRNIEYIAFGQKKYPCQLVTMNTLHKIIAISEHLVEMLCIPFEGSIEPIIIGNTLQLGPLVGIFTAGFTESLLRPIGDRSFMFANLIAENNHKNSFIFVFGTHGIDWEHETIQGYFFTNKRWTKEVVPFPTVIYNRLPNRKVEVHKSIKRVRQKLEKDYKIPWFNPGFFNKWDLYLKLKNEESVAHYLPKTVKFHNFDTIEELLSQYQFVYVKPENGSLGSKVILIRYQREEGIYYCRYRDFETNKLQKFSSLQSLISHVFRSMKLHDFIVQQGISLIRYEHQPVDFRVHTNKDALGKWHVTVIAAKVAGKGSTTTHINNGGRVKTLEELFDSEKAKRIHEKLSTAALKISESLDRQVDGYIGEIGFDIGVDKDEKIWLFEANSKPGRSIFSNPSFQENDKQIKKLFLEYATHLSKKGNELEVSMK